MVAQSVALLGRRTGLCEAGQALVRTGIAVVHKGAPEPGEGCAHQFSSPGLSWACLFCK